MRKPSQVASDFDKNVKEAHRLLRELSHQAESWQAFNAAALIHLATAGKCGNEPTGEFSPRFEDVSSERLFLSEHCLSHDNK